MGILRRKPKASDVVIDLTAYERPATQARWGLPGPCPSCSKPGYLDHIDPYREVMFQHCPSCGTKWEIARAEIDAVASA